MNTDKHRSMKMMKKTNNNIMTAYSISPICVHLCSSVVNSPRIGLKPKMTSEPDPHLKMGATEKAKRRWGQLTKPKIRNRSEA